MSSPRSWRATAMNSMPGSRAPSGPARGAVVIAQEIFGVNRHIRARRRWLRRGGLRDHRTLFVRSHPPRHRARLQREGNPGRPRLPPADSEGEDAARPHRVDQRGQTRRPRGGGRLLLGRHARLSRRLRTAGDLRRVVLRRADQGSPRQIAAAAGDVSLRRKGSLYSAGRRREDPRRRSERRVPPLSGGPRFQLRRARQLRCRQRATRARAHAGIPGRGTHGEANDQAQRLERCGRSAASSAGNGLPPIPAKLPRSAIPPTASCWAPCRTWARPKRAAPSKPRTPPCPPGRRRPRPSARRSCGKLVRSHARERRRSRRHHDRRAGQAAGGIEGRDRLRGLVHRMVRRRRQTHLRRHHPRPPGRQTHHGAAPAHRRGRRHHAVEFSRGHDHAQGRARRSPPVARSSCKPAPQTPYLGAGHGGARAARRHSRRRVQRGHRRRGGHRRRVHRQRQGAQAVVHRLDGRGQTTHVAVRGHGEEGGARARRQRALPGARRRRPRRRGHRRHPEQVPQHRPDLRVRQSLHRAVEGLRRLHAETHRGGAQAARR